MTISKLVRHAAIACSMLAIAFALPASGDSHGYVTDGLLVHFDALDNQGDGEFHSDATTWKDITPGADGTYESTTPFTRPGWRTPST